MLQTTNLLRNLY